MLVLIQGRRLARGPDRDDGGRALGDVPLHQAPKGLLIHPTIRMHGGNECNDAATNAKHGGAPEGLKNCRMVACARSVNTTAATARRHPKAPRTTAEPEPRCLCADR